MATKKTATKKPSAKKKTAKTVKRAAGKKTLIKKGSKYSCSVCGMVVTVDTACGCVETCDIICCSKKMDQKK